MLLKVQFLVTIVAYAVVVDGSRLIRSPGNQGWEGGFDSNPSVSSARSSGHGNLGRSSSWGGSFSSGARSFGNGGYGAGKLSSGWDNTNARSLGRSSNNGCNSGW